MLNVTKTLLKKAFKEKSLAALYVDLQEIEYRTYDADTPGSKHKAFVNCENLRSSFNKAGVENIWVAFPFDIAKRTYAPYFIPAISVEKFNERYSGTNAEFRIVKPEENEKVFLKKYIGAFHNIGLAPYIKEKQYKTLIMGGVSAGDFEQDGCFSATVKGALNSDPTLNVVLALDGTNLEGNFIPERQYMRQFLDDIPPRDFNSYLAGNEHTSRVHYAYTDEIIQSINEFRSELG